MVSREEVAQRRAKVAMLLMLDVSREDVCRRVGIDRRTFHRDVAAVRDAVTVETVAPNTAATEQTLKELDRIGRFEDIDRANIQLLRSLARSVDDEPYNAALWRQYREALEDMLRADEDADDDLAAALAEISSGTSVGDQTPP